jgi:hypothetical protein
LHIVPRHRRASWASRFYALFASHSERRIVRGIPVAVLWPSTAERAVAYPKLEDALGLIERYDPQRFRYLSRDARLIWLFGSVGALGSWHAETRILQLRLNYVIDTRTPVVEIASILVHEGTHARLRRLGFGYGERERARIEHVCFRAEIAFARRLPDAGDVIARAERQIARDPIIWTDAGRRAGYAGDLQALGVPRWLARLLSRLARSPAA